MVETPKTIREHTWHYSIKCNGFDKTVCCTMPHTLYNVDIKRIRLLQSKIVKFQSLDERRVRQVKLRKLSANVYELAMSYLSLFQISQVYSPGKTNLIYFVNPDLTFKGIFGKFEEYYKNVTGNTLTIKYKTYFKFFRETGFTFRKPKSVFCRELEIKLEKDPIIVKSL